MTLILIHGLVLGVTGDLDLMEERRRPAAAGRDSLFFLRLAGMGLLFAHWAIAGLDVGRFHWSDNIPPGLRAFGLAGVAGALSIVRWAQHVNRFFSAAMRIQRDRGHVVITSGPYRWVRHPGYAAFILGSLCSGLALGSWWSLVPPVLVAARFLRRAAQEDRMLQQELEGYREYAAKVRYRLLPGVW
jgi:protein-S-isoprenylcysteine O-methyltransferase Ste14